MDALTEKEDVKQLSKDHVDWLLTIIRPLLITEFEHGYKHGLEQGIKIREGHKN